MYQNIVVALDGSEFAEKVLPHVEALAAKFGSSVTLLRARTPSTVIIAETSSMSANAPVVVDPTPIIEAEKEEAETYLSGVAKRLSAQGLTVQYKHSEGHAADAIVELARQLGADLVALTTHGRQGVVRVIMGSVADAVVRRAPCPVLLVRVHEAGGHGKR
jgi:nucleotide-binding universal stress UspA family protein